MFTPELVLIAITPLNTQYVQELHAELSRARLTGRAVHTLFLIAGLTTIFCGGTIFWRIAVGRRPDRARNWAVKCREMVTLHFRHDEQVPDADNESDEGEDESSHGSGDEGACERTLVSVVEEIKG
jgi:hypothetical protein